MDDAREEFEQARAQIVQDSLASIEREERSRFVQDSLHAEAATADSLRRIAVKASDGSLNALESQVRAELRPLISNLRESLSEERANSARLIMSREAEIFELQELITFKDKINANLRIALATSEDLRAAEAAKPDLPALAKIGGGIVLIGAILVAVVK